MSVVGISHRRYMELGSNHSAIVENENQIHVVCIVCDIAHAVSNKVTVKTDIGRMLDHK